MFINFFKSGFISQYLIILLIGLFLWMKTFVSPVPMPAPAGEVPLYTLLYAYTAEFPRIAAILGFILVLAETYFLAAILSRHELVLKNSSLPALIFIICMSFLPEFQTLTPANLAVALLIVILYQLLIFYNKPDHLDRIFITGFTTGLGCLVYMPFLPWFFLLPVSFIIFRVANWRAWMAAFTGLVTPFLYLAVWAFWNGQFSTLFTSFFHDYTQIDLSRPVDNMIRHVLLLIPALLFIWGYLFHHRVTDKVVEIRAKTSVFLWTILFMAVTFPLARTLNLHHLLLVSPVFALVISRTLINLKKVPVAETLLLVCFLTAVVNIYLIPYL